MTKIREVLLNTDIPYREAVLLRAGKLSAIYEEGRIRYVRYGNKEMIRLIYPALRSADWTTIPAVITNEKKEIRERSFLIQYNTLYESGDIRYRATFSIEGTSDSRMVFSMKGEALQLFQAKRIGFCVLHPIETCSGKEVRVTGADGFAYTAPFPIEINPHQPFKNIRTMEWELDNGVSVKLQLEGDVFETEDQRNWSDHSYKTYSRPADLPAPFDVQAGETIEQVVSIQINTESAGNPVETIPPPAIKFRFPLLGYARGKQQVELNQAEAELLKQLPLDHLLVNLSTGDDHWQEELNSAAKDAGRLKTKLILHVLFSSLTGETLNTFILHIATLKAVIHSVLILSAAKTAPPAFYAKAYAAIKENFPAIAVGYGTAGNFADLNRNRPGGLPLDFVSFHVQPQAHQTDGRTITENLQSLPQMIRTAAAIAANKPVYVSPVTFSKRGNSDERLHSGLGVWYTLGAIAQLAGADRITFYELTGNAGLICNGEPTPVFNILKTLKEFSPVDVWQHTGGGIVFGNSNDERLVFTSGFSELIPV